MFYIKGKRGLSDVIITVIIILLSLVAIGIVWFVVSNILSEGSGSVGLGQFLINLDITKASKSGNDISVTVKRTAGAGDMTGMRFIVSDGFNSESFDEMTILDQLQERTFIITTSSLAVANAKTISVASFHNTNNEEFLGDITDTYTFGTGTSEGGTDPPGNDDNDDNDDNGEVVQCSPACTGDSTCVNGVCVSPGCESEPVSETCEGWVCSTRVNNCGEIISCGTCGALELCNNLVGQCELITPISGIVYSVWPIGVATYFDSEDLPTNDIYSGYFAKFLSPSQESECLMVEGYDLPQPPQERVIVKLLATQTSVAASDSVQLWPTYNSCIA